MNTVKTDKIEGRVLVLMPTGRDGDLIAATLEKVEIGCHQCHDASELCAEIGAGAGAALIAEEALPREALTKLIDTFRHQPVWSDLPVVLFSSSGVNAERLLKELSPHLNATIVERPIRITILLSAIRGALRARFRQYQARDNLLRLEEADKQKDLFLATLSHELRTPLNSIVGWIKLLRGKPNIAGADLDHALDVIERNAKAQAEIIADILFVSRVVTGKLELRCTPTDLVGVVKEAIDAVRPSIEAKGLRTEISIPPDALRINGDADRLRQVFLNLLSNAVKFTETGGTISVSVTESEAGAEVAVGDTGRGIEPEFLPHVFERFSQADNQYSRKIGGLGLGLAIVRHLIELHGGNVWAESEGTGRGATFRVRLPILAAAEPIVHVDPNTGGDKKDAVKLEQLNVLLVEDDDDSREMLTTFLIANGMRVTAVDTAPEAIEQIRTLLPDVLISDVGLPGQDGYQMMSEIRALPPDEGGLTPAIALTGYVSMQDRNRALTSGFQDHLAKPIDFDQLMARLDLIVRRAKRNLG